MSALDRVVVSETADERYNSVRRDVIRNMGQARARMLFVSNGRDDLTLVNSLGFDENGKIVL